MNRVISVKGVGSVSRRPDTIECDIRLETMDKNYRKSMEKTSVKIEKMKSAVVSAGLNDNELKTVDFRIDTVHESEQDGNGNYKTVFKGYQCIHHLKISFEWNMKILSSLLNGFAEKKVLPQVNIRFTVKDPAEVSNDLLENAAKNALEKANVLCSASGVRLGKLNAIHYNWGDVNVFSRTELCSNDMFGGKMKKDLFFASDFEPDNIETSDTATFIWEIE